MDEAQIQKKVTQAARDFLEAVRKHDVKTILAIEVVFWPDSRGPRSSPCVYVKAPGVKHEPPTLCFENQRGRWRL